MQAAESAGSWTENWSYGAAVLVVLTGVALLTLAAQLYDAQRARPQWPVRVGAALAAATGLWWPLLVWGDALSEVSAWLAWALAIAAAELTMFGARALRAPPGDGRLGLLGVPLALLLLALACALALALTPVRPGSAAVAGVVDGIGLSLIWLPRGRAGLSVALRALLALLVTLVPAIVLGVAEHAPLLPRLSASELVPVLPPALAAIGLLGVLWHQLLGRPVKSTAAELDVEASERLVDGLTKLATRLGIERELAAAAAQCDARGGRLAVLIVDIDAFNPVNSSFGHEFGDRLLALMAERLRAHVGPHDVAGRIGGDDFVVIHSVAGNAEAVSRFAAELLAALSKPYLVDGREISVACSAGIAQYPDDGGQTRMLACAEAAKTAAKRMGGACHCFYVHGMDGDAREQLDLLRDLRRAVEREELELFFQPKVDALSGQITAAEALLRWRHPTRGLLSPAVFIPIAEHYGFMGDLGNWVITDACRQARIWRDAGLRMRVAINLSAQQMRQADIVDRIAGNLQRYRVHPSLLTCEITETVAMEDTAATQQTFQRLGQLGVHLSIDDFGTGYSSLSYLRQLPASELKIDRAFVTDIATSQDARAVVDAVIKLAHALGLRVVAEGVETAAQQQVLTGMGCDELQGYLFSRPMSAQAIQLWAVGEEQGTTLPAFRASLFGDTMM